MKNVRCGKAIFVAASMLLCLSADASNVVAAKFNRVMDIGKQAPAWKDLRGTDGKSHSLSDLKNAKAVIVVFTCNHCPVAQAYEKRLIKLALESRKKGVEMVAISVSRYEADNFESMKKRAAEKKYPFKYLQDTSQKTGKEYGALWTPNVFLLDSKRRIAYMGGLDDSMYPEKVQKRFLQDAIDAVLKGNTVEISETKPVGCQIEYD
jgi:peroxiredoxin